MAGTYLGYVLTKKRDKMSELNEALRVLKDYARVAVVHASTHKMAELISIELDDAENVIRRVLIQCKLDDKESR